MKTTKLSETRVKTIIANYPAILSKLVDQHLRKVYEYCTKRGVHWYYSPDDPFKHNYNLLRVIIEDNKVFAEYGVFDRYDSGTLAIVPFPVNHLWEFDYEEYAEDCAKKMIEYYSQKIAQYQKKIKQCSDIIEHLKKK